MSRQPERSRAPQPVGDVVISLTAEWKGERAEACEAIGDTRGAIMYRRLAEEVEQALRASAADTLTLQEASAESGYSADHLGRLLRQGKLPNAGRPKAPKIRRADLPQKPGAAPRSHGRNARETASLSAITREVIAAKLPHSRRA